MLESLPRELSGLATAGVPFAVMTGHDAGQIGEVVLRTAPYLGKPYGLEDLGAMLARLAARSYAAPPHPPNSSSRRGTWSGRRPASSSPTAATASITSSGS